VHWLDFNRAGTWTRLLRLSTYHREVLSDGLTTSTNMAVSINQVVSKDALVHSMPLSWQSLMETPSLFLDEIGEWLAIYHDQPISTTALHMNLYDLIV
jgi:hypothetical protein